MHTVIKTYKFKLYNSKKNKYLDRSIDIAAQIWNYCIAMERRYYKFYGKYLPANRLMKHNLISCGAGRIPLRKGWEYVNGNAVVTVVKAWNRRT